MFEKAYLLLGVFAGVMLVAALLVLSLTPVIGLQEDILSVLLMAAVAPIAVAVLMLVYAITWDVLFG